MDNLMRNVLPFLSRKLLILVGLVVLTGCAVTSRTNFPVTQANQEALNLDNVSVILLTAGNISSYSASQQNWPSNSPLPISSESWQYLIGVGDVLSITVWDYPELTLPAGPERSQLESGSWVNASGNIFYPYIGEVNVVGSSIEQIQRSLTNQLQEYIPDPQIEVKVAAFNSQKVLITGAVARPGAIDITNLPISLIEAVNALGGLLDSADSHRVSIQRNGKVYFVNLHNFLVTGRADNNPILKGNDIINIGTLANNVAHVLGQIQRPGLVELGIDGTNLTEAISLRGGLNEDLADAQGIFVFRAKASGQGIDVFQIDATTPLAFVLGTKFALFPDDIVYVVTDPAARWNSIITDLLPSISAIRGAQSIGSNF